MKKLMVMVMSIILILSCAACGKSENGKESKNKDTDTKQAETEAVKETEKKEETTEKSAGKDTDKAETAGEIKKIGVAVGSATDVWATYWMDEVKKYGATFPGYEFAFEDAGDYDLARQISQVENFINNGYDAIIMIPADASSCGSITSACKDAGVPLIVAEIRLANQDEATALAASDAYEGGLLQASYVMEDMMKGKGKVVVLQGKAGNDNAIYRYQAACEVADRNPEIEITATDIANWDRSEAMRIMETWIQSGVEFDCVLAGNDEMAIGASLALQNAGMRDGKIIAGFDATDEGKNAIKDGTLDITMLFDAVGQAHAAVDLAIGAVEGTMEENEIMVPHTVITKENVDKY